MNAERRAALAAAAAALTSQVQQAVVASWWSMVPAAAGWDAEQREDARAASEAILRAIIGVLYQSDLDVASIERTRALVFERGRASGETGAQLLRAVRVVGLDLLAARLAERAAMNAEERWQLEQEAAAFCDTLLAAHEGGAVTTGAVAPREPSDPDPYGQVLAELERADADLR